MKNRTAYENTLNHAIGAAEYAMTLIRSYKENPKPPETLKPLESLSREDYIAYRKLRQIKESLEILREDSRAITFPNSYYPNGYPKHE